MYRHSTKLRTPAALFILLALLSGLVGCSSPTPTFAPTVVAPTVDLQPTLAAVQTQAVQTVVANLTKNAPTAASVKATQAVTATLGVTATTAPSATLAAPAATNTPVPPTAAPTATYIPWTLTPTQAPYSCSMVEVLPKVTTTYAINSNFDTQWIVKNTGAKKWIKSETDVRYSTGTKMQKLGDILDLKNDVAPGENYTILVDMVTPATVGTYTDTFVLITGKITICTISVTVTVK